VVMARVEMRSGLSPAEFLVWEREQPNKHEYFHGQVFDMAGGSPRHNALSARITGRLDAQLAPRGCITLSSDQRIGIDLGARYVYPDVTVICGPVELQEGTTDVVVNPTIVVEVLSSSTEQYDRGLKWEAYQRLPSVTDYLLVSQVEPRIEHFRRDANGTWIYRAAATGDRITLTNSAVLDIDAVFSGVIELPGG